MDRKEIACLLDLIAKSEFDDVELTIGDFYLHVRRKPDAGKTAPGLDAATRPAGANAVDRLASIPPEMTASSPESNSMRRVDIKAPMLGTFYRSPSPGAPAFVQVGDRVSSNQTIGLLEVMKLFNPVLAGVSGIVAAIEAGDSELVEYGQLLMVIEEDA